MFLLCSRVLLLLVGILIAIIPWSERYCALDNFPQGQDFETNLLAFLAIAGLMLLLAHLCEQAVSALFSIRCRVSRLCSEIRQHGLPGTVPLPSHRAPLPSPLTAACNLPLQI
jgi:hypothetical protein